MRGRWQVVRLRQGAVTVCCRHRYEQVAGWCADWRSRREPDVQHDIRPEPEETR